MQHHVILAPDHTVLIISEKEKEEVLLRGAKILKSGLKKECDRWYDEFCDEYGYTGPIWDNLEINY